MNENDLELKISGLEKVIQEKQADFSRYSDELKIAQKQLKDINKPAITPMVMDEISEAIESAVEDFDFSDDDNFEKEFEIDYDSRIKLSNLDFTNSCDLIAEIVEKVLNLFKEEDCPTDEENARDDKEAEELNDELNNG